MTLKGQDEWHLDFESLYTTKEFSPYVTIKKYRTLACLVNHELAGKLVSSNLLPGDLHDLLV